MSFTVLVFLLFIVMFLGLGVFLFANKDSVARSRRLTLMNAIQSVVGIACLVTGGYFATQLDQYLGQRAAKADRLLQLTQAHLKHVGLEGITLTYEGPIISKAGVYDIFKLPRFIVVGLPNSECVTRAWAYQESEDTVAVSATNMNGVMVPLTAESLRALCYGPLPPGLITASTEQ